MVQMLQRKPEQKRYVYSFPCNNVNRTCNRVSNNNNIKLDNVNDIKLNKLVMLN